MYIIKSEEMLLYLFYIFFISLLSTFCLLHGLVCAEDDIKQSSVGVTLFTADTAIKISDELFNAKPDEQKKAINLYSPFLVAADDVIVAITEMLYREKQNRNTEIVERYIDIRTKDDCGERVAKNSGSWSKKVSISNPNQDENGVKRKGNAFFKFSFAVGTEKKIYILAIGYNGTNEHAYIYTDGIKWNFEFFVGDVRLKDEQNQKTQPDKTIIEWKKDDDIASTLTREFKKKFSEVFPYFRSAFLTNHGRVVFVAMTRSNAQKKVLFPVFIQLTVRNNKIQWELLSVENTENCDSLYFFPWKRKIVSFKYCTNGTEGGAYETTDMGKTWRKVGRSAFNVLSFLEKDSVYKSVTINNRRALLFTKSRLFFVHPDRLLKYSLWVTDGGRAHNVGLLFYDDKYITFRSLLYTDSALFVLHDRLKKEYKSKELILTCSKELVGKTAAVLDTWANVSDVVLRLCNQMIDQPSDICNMQSFTDGLVGFLFNASDINKQWKDEYLYANATVTNGTKVENGFKFDKAGAGAKWPVGKQRGEQPYNFTDPGFTLVAAVTVDNVYEKDNSVLGVDYREEFFVEKRLGLWCTTEGKWRVKSKEKSFHPGSAEISLETVINGEVCEQGKTYLVALLLNDGKFSVHVNGEKVGRTSENILINRTKANIMQFYFGADNFQNDDDFDVLPLPRTTQQHNAQQNDEESHVTVRNVLLYTRPFSYDDIKKFKLKQNEISQSFGDDWKKGPMSINGSSSHGSGGAVNNTLNLKENTNKESAVHGGVLLSLLLSLLFAFALI